MREMAGKNDSLMEMRLYYSLGRRWRKWRKERESENGGVRGFCE